MLPSPDSLAMASRLTSYAPQYAIHEISPKRMYLLGEREHNYKHDRTMAQWKDVIDIFDMFDHSRAHSSDDVDRYHVNQT